MASNSSRGAEERIERIVKHPLKLAVPALFCLVLSLGTLGMQGAGAVSGATSKAASASTVLNLAFTTDMPDPDPDIFYFTEGNAIVTNVYDDIVQYAHNDSFKVVPDLAESWTITNAGKTYTFHLRPNVHFHTGGVMTSADVKFALERRDNTKINSPMAYLTEEANITSIGTPNPLTVVLNLKQPDIDFLSDLASPYGVKVISQAAVLAHQVNGDLGQKWLQTHDAGTGAFTITTFEPGKEYVLSRFKQYWGPKPELSAVNITVVPSSTTQLLELQQGQLGMIIHGLTVSEIGQLAKSPDYHISIYPATYKLWVNVNMNHGLFTSQALRTALAEAINRQYINSQIYGPYGKPSVDFYIPGEVPAGTALDDPKYDSSALASLVAKLPASKKKVSLVYTTDDQTNEQAAEILQTELEADGLNVSLQGVPLSDGFTYLQQSPKLDPDIMLFDGNPDSGNADVYARPFVGGVGVGDNGSLNSFRCVVPNINTQLSEGLYSNNQAASTKVYETIGTEAAKVACFDSISEVRDVIVTSSKYGNINHQIGTVWSVPFADITVK
jgi:peptide/nickel transport system substrate-binding protein